MPSLWWKIFTCEKIVDELETFKTTINLTEYAAAVGRDSFGRTVQTIPEHESTEKSAAE